MKRLFTTALITALLSVSLFAGDTEDLTKLVQEKVEYFTSVLRDKSLTKEAKNVKMEAASDYLFDYALMGMLSLGKKEWSELKGAKRDEYTQLFESRIKNSYMDKLHLYTDEQVEVNAAFKEKTGRIYVPCVIIAKDGKTDMVYKFYKSKKGSWLIYDVEIAGVSIVQTYRAQFAEILKTKDVFGLIEKMRSNEQL